MLKDLARNELVWVRRAERGLGFRLAPFVVGVYEAHLYRMDRESAELFERYMAEGGAKALMEMQPPLQRVLPAQGSVDAESILPYDDVKNLVLNARGFSLRDCVCRYERSLVAEACSAPLATCLTLGDVERPPHSHVISRQQALDILDQTEEPGLVHTVMNTVRERHLRLQLLRLLLRPAARPERVGWRQGGGARQLLRRDRRGRGAAPAGHARRAARCMPSARSAAPIPWTGRAASAAACASPAAQTRQPPAPAAGRRNRAPTAGLRRLGRRAPAPPPTDSQCLILTVLRLPASIPCAPVRSCASACLAAAASPKEDNVCGIVGYVGQRDAAPLLLDGLKRLEYRGYDSAGIAVISDGQVRLQRAVGKLNNLEKLSSPRRSAGHIGIGHTRWATHGRPVRRKLPPPPRLPRRDRRYPQRHRRELPVRSRPTCCRKATASPHRPTPRSSPT